MTFARALGRLLFACVFLYHGVNHLVLDVPGANAGAVYGFAKSGVTKLAATYGFDIAPVVPPLVIAICTFQVLGGLLFTLGLEKIGAALLLTFIVPITVVMHWPLTATGALDTTQINSLLTNSALIGALLIVLGGRSSRKVKEHGE